MNTGRAAVVYGRMYLLRALLPAPALLAPERIVAHALDASRDEPARVGAVRRLHALAAGSDLARAIARALVPVLNEPLWWLPSEVLSLIALVRAGVILGVDRRGRIASSPTPVHGFVGDGSGAVHCPSLGPVVAARNVLALAPRVAPMPWLTVERRASPMAWL